ncbi:alpha/beta fold hydrolase [Pseudonocardia endophytica]|uniref:AB hydrolase-1 domain-containing protein n=1 Tax=Pseudonocardia endophytica TaxID=401976 RepID=A0A4R1HX63_PSEEN|nr:alpha/beta fold hydrolase [Pseudonocardia endophytica]TCK24639.1 hypothetical protein EV378_0418 [Pseudonocardia endophytica]
MLSSMIVGGLHGFARATALGLDRNRGEPPEHLAARPGTHSALLIGGFATTTPLLGPLEHWLIALGYDVVPTAVGAGLACGRRTVDALESIVRDETDHSGRRVQLVGHSRGGQFARSLAHRVPDRVSGVVTVATPFDLAKLSWPMRALLGAVAGARATGVEGVAGVGCLVGNCCRTFRTQMHGPLPDGVAFTSIWSPDDRVAPPAACREPEAENVEVRGGHNALLTGTHARRAVAEALLRGTRRRSRPRSRSSRSTHDRRRGPAVPASVPPIQATTPPSGVARAAGA